MKKRFSNILSKGGKKNGIAVLIFAVVLATLLGVLVGCTQKTPTDDVLDRETLNTDAESEPAATIDNETSALSDDEMNRLINEYLRFERYTVYDSMSFTSNNPDSGVWIGDTFVPEIGLDGSYYPSSEEGLTTWQEWLDFLNGLFTPEATEEKLEELTGEGKHYMNVDGKLYVLPSGGMGWPYSSPAQAGYKTNGSEGVIEFWREDISEGSEGTYRITVFRLNFTDLGWRIHSVESYDTYSAIEGYQPILDKPSADGEPTAFVTEVENDEPVVVPVDEETTALANEIMEGLLDDYREAVNILLLDAAKPVSYSNGVDEYGNLVIDGDEWYIRMQDEYNTPEKVMDVMHSVFTNEKCDAIYLQYFVESKTFKMIDGELYCADGGMGYSSFNTPFEGAVKISDTEILAKTKIVYDADYPYEVTFKYEDGEWKIDKLVEDGREVNF